MGVPKFFRWICERYPLILQPLTANEQPPVDNFYLDANAIIHRCTHPDADKVLRQPTEKEAILAIFQYIEKLFHLMQPQQVFFIAIDGSAPRAKMNQQRQRRFRSATSAPSAAEGTFDSNSITPGTAFMSRLTEQLQYFIRSKMSTDFAWQKCQIIFSGSDVAGEGEHKIMDLMRSRRSQPGYNPNESHCLYGLDADLIMLALASHEPNFTLLREEVKFLPPRDNQRLAASSGSSRANTHQLQTQESFYLLQICLVREYLDMEFSCFKALPLVPSGQYPVEKVPEGSVHDPSNRLILPPTSAAHPENSPRPLPFGYDLERVIDDFVLICFLCGNDFLPALPTLDIGEDALSCMFVAYKTLLPSVDGYLTESGKIHFDRLEKLFALLAVLELPTLSTRAQDRVSFLHKQKKEAARADRKKNEGAAGAAPSAAADADAAPASPVSPLASPIAVADVLNVAEAGEDADDMEQFAAEVLLSNYNKSTKSIDFAKYRASFYGTKHKFHVDDEQEFKKEMDALKHSFVEGLMWVEQYYHKGVVSWQWYYPFHYGILCSDLTSGLSAIADSIQFELGEPFKPFEQLMGVLPSASSYLLPTVYQSLMTSAAGSSPISDFYPLEFEIDREGFKNEREGIALLPFIDQQRLLQAAASIDPLTQLTEAERKRNTFGTTLIFTYDPIASASAAVPSSWPESFPAIQSDKSKCTVYEWPLSRPGFEPRLLDGCMTGSRIRQGFPTFASRWHVVHFEKAKVVVFDSRPSQKTSAIITLLPTQNSSQANTAQFVAPFLLNSICFVGYPYVQELSVTMVCDSKVMATAYNGGLPPPGGVPGAPVMIPQTEETSNQFTESLKAKKHVNKSRFGLNIDMCKVLVFGQKFSGMRKNANGDIYKSFAASASIAAAASSSAAANSFLNACVPLELIHGDNFAPLADSRFAPVAAESIAPGSDIIFLGQAPYFGLNGKVNKFEHGHFEVVLTKKNGMDAFASTARLSAVSLGAGASSSAADESLYMYEQSNGAKYHAGYHVARIVGCSPLTVSRITGVVLLADGVTDIGLGLRFSSNSLRVPGYVRKSTRPPGPNYKPGGRSSSSSSSSSSSTPSIQWEYSQRCVDLLQQYKSRFPSVFAALDAQANNSAPPAPGASASGPGSRSVNPPLKMEQICPLGASESTALIEWIKSLPHHSMMALHVDSYCVHPALIARLEAALEASAATDTFTQYTLVLEDANLLHKKSDPSPNMDAVASHFSTLDRVVCVSSTGSVPFGCTGTVVGVNNESSTVDILFDNEFLGASSLNGRCKGLRGATVAVTSLLNLTKPTARYTRKALALASTAQLDRNGKVLAAPLPSSAAAGVAPLPLSVALPKPGAVTGTAPSSASSSSALSPVSPGSVAPAKKILVESAEQRAARLAAAFDEKKEEETK